MMFGTHIPIWNVETQSGGTFESRTRGPTFRAPTRLSSEKTHRSVPKSEQRDWRNSKEAPRYSSEFLWQKKGEHIDTGETSTSTGRAQSSRRTRADGVSWGWGKLPFSACVSSQSNEAKVRLRQVYAISAAAFLGVSRSAASRFPKTPGRRRRSLSTQVSSATRSQVDGERSVDGGGPVDSGERRVRGREDGDGQNHDESRPAHSTTGSD